jgi:thiamine-phosphate pyrophosphorylase
MTEGRQLPGARQCSKSEPSAQFGWRLLAKLSTMQLYAITSRRLLPAGESTRRAALVKLARQWAKEKIDYIQIREKDLIADDLFQLAKEITAAVRKENQTTKVLLNGPAEIALASGADGIHFPANAAAEARTLYAHSGREAILSHACHSVQEVLEIREESQQNPHATTANTLILYAPVFEKITPEGQLPGQGLEALRTAVRAAGNIPVFALGGVTLENAPFCVSAGAAGIAAIRLFFNRNWQTLRM